MDSEFNQLEANIDTIIEYLWKVPGVTEVEVDTKVLDEGIIWQKKVFLTFAGCKEHVVLEIY